MYLKKYSDKSLFVLSLFLMVLLCGASLRAAGEVDPNFVASAFIGSQGAISQTIVQPDGKILIAGSFQVVGKYGRRNIARLNTDGSIDLTFSSPELLNSSFSDSFVKKLVLQSDGKILVGGEFSITNLGNRGLIRLNPNGSLDADFSNSTMVSATSGIADLALTLDGKIIYSTFNAVVRLNSDGTLDRQASGNLSQFAAQSDGKIIAYSESSFRISRYNQDLTVDGSFPSIPISGTVRDIVIQADGKFLIAGGLFAVNGFTINRIARINSAGTIDASFNIGTIGANQPIEVIKLLANGKILIGGAFTTLNNTAANHLARLNSADGSLDTTFNLGNTADAIVNDLALQADGKIVTASVPMFRLNADGAIDSSFTSPIIGSAGTVSKVLVQPDNKILVGGYFTRANEKQINGLARFNADGTVDNSFNQTATLNASVLSIALQPDGKIIAVGNGFGGAVRLNSDGSLDRYINVGSVTYDVNLQPDGKIIFSTQTLIFRFNADGTIDNSFPLPSTNGGIISGTTVQPDGKILVVGNFTQISGTSRSRVARLNADGTVDASFNPLGGANAAVYEVVMQTDGKIIVGGDFTGFNFDTGKKYLARLNSDGSLDTTFAPFLDTRVRAIKLQTDGKILFGGITNLPVSNPVPGKIGRFLGDGTLDPTFYNTIAIDQVVNSIDLQADNKIILGGYFSRVNGIANLGVARLLNSARGVFDFDGDGKTDLSIFRPNQGEWWYLRSSDGGNYAAQFGTSTDKLVPADFTGDGKTDIAFFRPSSGEWFILRSEDNSFYAFPFGTTGDIPIVGNFDADNRSDVGVFRPSNSTWYIQKSAGGTDIIQFGVAGDVPVTSDYDGDGRTDIAIYRPSLGQWWINRSTAGTIAYQFGTASDKPVFGDYTGDGKADVAFWRPSTGEWFVLRSENISFYAFPFGTSTDIPAPGDYDGDGRFDATVFRPSNSTWYSQRTTAGTLIQQFGITGDKPVPAAFVP